METNGGLISQADLATRAPEENEPLWGEYRLPVLDQPSAMRRFTLIEMLNILENSDLAAQDITPNTSGWLRAMKIATVDKDTKVGDPRFHDVPVAELTSIEYAARKAELIKRGEICAVPRVNQGGGESKHTTQVTVTDEHSNCVTMTHTLGQPSGVVTDGLGFMYNGAMTVVDPRPGHAGSLAPGKARFTAVSPTIIFKDATPYLVLGAPGATYITMGNLQVMLNVLDFGMSAQEAVLAPLRRDVGNHRAVDHPALRRARLAGPGLSRAAPSGQLYFCLGPRHSHRRRQVGRRRRCCHRWHGDGDLTILHPTPAARPAARCSARYRPRHSACPRRPHRDAVRRCGHVRS